MEVTENEIVNKSGDEYRIYEEILRKGEQVWVFAALNKNKLERAEYHVIVTANTPDYVIEQEKKVGHISIFFSPVFMILAGGFVLGIIYNLQNRNKRILVPNVLLIVKISWALLFYYLSLGSIVLILIPGARLFGYIFLSVSLIFMIPIMFSSKKRITFRQIALALVVSAPLLIVGMLFVLDFMDLSPLLMPAPAATQLISGILCMALGIVAIVYIIGRKSFLYRK